MSPGRKRVVSSCVPCYTRKQKCNRQYPCNHCARRRLPEECAYYSTATRQTSDPPEPRREETRSDKEPQANSPSLTLRKGWSAHVNSAATAVSSSSSPLAELFGYFEDSESNTLAIIRKLGLGADDSSPALPPEAGDEVSRYIDEMPDRQILDFLIRYFVAEVNWMDHLVHAPWFLTRYQRWWALDRMTLVVEVDFAVLILRICSYALQFLPSPSYTLNKIRGALLSDICTTCDEIAESLATISSAFDGRGSLIRVQHLAFLGLRCQMEGRRDALWDVLSRAIRVAQSVGIHTEAASLRPGLDEMEKEMGRRTFCSLFIWDSLLSRQLDRAAFLPGCLNPENWPRMHLGTVGDGSGTELPWDAFTERLLQARLADFWRRIGPVAGADYDMIVAEERYERFCREYLAELPPAFALLRPNEAWDKRLPKLPLQRQLLHIAIYDSLCWNFRPLLLRLAPEPTRPAYKRMLLASQKQALVVAALRVLDGVSQLHALLGGCHTRFAALIFPTFEAAVLLVYLCMDPPLFSPPPPLPHHDHQDGGDTHDRNNNDDDDFFAQTNTVVVGGGSGGSDNVKDRKDPDPLRAGPRHHKPPTRQECMEAVQGALDRLRMLAEVSNMADVGANTLTQLLSKAPSSSSTTTTTTTMTATTMHGADEVPVVISNEQMAAGGGGGGDLAGCTFSFDLSDLTASSSSSSDDFLSSSAMQDLQGSWATSMMDFVGPLTDRVSS